MASASSVTSVLEIIFYGPAALLTITLAAKHGYGWPESWLRVCIWLLVHSGLRLTNAALSLVTYEISQCDALYYAVILDSVCLGPILLILVAILRTSHAGQPNGWGSAAFVPAQLIAIGATVVTALGGRALLFEEYDANLGQLLTRIGALLFLAGYFVILFMAFWTSRRWDRSIPTKAPASHALGCVFLCTPLLIVRLVYAINSTWLDPYRYPMFSPLAPSGIPTWVHFIMAIATEGAVVAAALATGFATKRPPRATEADTYII